MAQPQQQHATSPMSITQLCNFEQQQREKDMTHSHDSDVQLAAEALGDMSRSGVDNKGKTNSFYYQETITIKGTLHFINVLN